MATKKLTISIEKCIDCPHHSILPDPDPSDWFNRDDCKIVCKAKTSPLNPEGISIAMALRPYEVKNVEIPNWCPL